VKANLFTKEELAAMFRVNNDGELERLSRGRWQIVENKLHVAQYYCRAYFRGKYVRYHRIVWILINGSILDSTLEVDHIDGNRLNNKIENLRLVNSRVNNQNTVGHRTTGRVGYYWKKDDKKWCTQIEVAKIRVHIGLYNLESEAAEAYKIACKLSEIYVDNASFRKEVNEILSDKGVRYEV